MAMNIFANFKNLATIPIIDAAIQGYSTGIANGGNIRMLTQVVHFVLKKKWFDMIASGEKTVEYRKFSGYWANRLYGKNTAVFHFGYTKKIMIFEIKRIKFSLKTLPEADKDLKKTEWGFNPKEDLFLIVLGKRLPEGEGII